MSPPSWLYWPEQVTGGTFAPTDISGCVSWFDASDSSTITIATGVSNWADKSGNVASSPYDTADFIQATTAEQPTVTSGHINGLDVITFNGTSQDLIGRMPHDMSSASVFIVGSPSDTRFICINAIGTTAYCAAADSGSTFTGIYTNFGTPTHYVTGNATSWVNRGDVYTDIGTSTQIYEAIGCNLQAFANATATRNYALAGFGGDFQYAGDICEIVIYNSSLATSDRESVEGYLAHKWGIEASLPSGHPYKSIAP